MPESNHKAVRDKLITDRDALIDKIHTDAKMLLSIQHYLVATAGDVK